MMNGLQDQLPDVLAGSTERIKFGETGTGMPGVMPASMSQSLDIPSMTQALNPGMTGSMMEDNAMTTSMTASTTSLNQKIRRSKGHRNETSQNWFSHEAELSTEGRAELAAKEREREERMKRIKESQEEERRRKLDELKVHAVNAQKFREQQEQERRRHIEELRSRDMDRRQQVEERRRDIERAEQERRELIIAKNRERDERLSATRRHSRGHLEHAFGSSAPRMMDARDSAYWGTRSVYEQRRSVEREGGDQLKAKRTTSAQGLDRSNEGDEYGLAGVPASPCPGAHRRRTDLMPAILIRSQAGGGQSTAPNTPGRAVSLSRIDGAAAVCKQPRPSMASSKSMSHLAAQKKTQGPRPTPTANATYHVRAKTGGNLPRKQGLSRENSTASRPSSAMSGGGRGGGVRLRSATSAPRRPRPLSIATTGMTSSMNGMTASMYEERGSKPRQKSFPMPRMERNKRARSVTSDQALDDDQKSNSSTASGLSNTVRPSSARKTPAQVKAEAAARKAKVSASKGAGTPKASSKTVSPALSTDALEDNNEHSKRQITPDIIKDNGKKDKSEEPEPQPRKEETTDPEKEEEKAEKEDEKGEKEDKPEKKIIASEEEAKARLAEKRREMKEKKEREEELERQRLEEERRIEEERIRKEEEEERRVMEETERMAEIARKQEEERIQKAIEENEAEQRRVKEEEERERKEKEETEKKNREEAERREAELQEKLKKEEEERQARKKRIEEIMARTRGKNSTPTSTPKKEPEEKTEIPQQQPSQPISLDSNVDPTKPDLLGDINVQSENQKNLQQQNGGSADNAEKDSVKIAENGDDVPTAGGDVSFVPNGEHSSNGLDSTPELEKGALDSLSNKSDEGSIKSSIQSPLIEVDGSSKKSTLEVEFDEILDLSGDNRSAGGVGDAPPQPPIIAFEAPAQQADLMS